MTSYNSDLQLIAGVQVGRRDALERLLDIYEDRVYNLVMRMVGSADAEDVAQEALIEICRSITGFRGASSLSTWVYRVAANVCLEHRRRRRPEVVPIEDDLLECVADGSCDPGSVAVQHEVKYEVDAAIESLSEIYRDVVVLHELQGLTYEECAKVLDCPVGTVKSRLSNAFKALRERLRDYASESGLAT